MNKIQIKFLILLLLLTSCSKKDDYCKFDTIVLQYEENSWSMGEVYPIVIKEDTINKLSIKLNQ